MSEASTERRAVASLVAARIVYAVNWLNIGPIFVLMERTLNTGIVGLGAVTAGFYIGIGLAQVPAGILAARFGPKRVVIAGIILFSFATIGVSASTLTDQVVVFRSLVGVGMALVFAPAVVLMGRFLGGGKIGVGVGVLNSAYDVGGLLGLYAWTVLATVFGWQSSIALGGGLGILTGVLVAGYVRRDPESLEFKVKIPSLFKILKDRELILLGLGTLGLEVGNILITSFMAYYLNRSLGVSLQVSALAASMVVVVPIAASIWAGRLYDSTRRPKLMMIIADLGMAFALLLVAVPSFPAALVSVVVAGVTSGLGFTVTFAWARDLNRAEKEYDGLAIAWVNSISLFGSFLPPLVFSFLVGMSGYPVAWAAGAVFCLALTVPLLFQKEVAQLRGGSR